MRVVSRAMAASEDGVGGGDAHFLVAAVDDGLHDAVAGHVAFGHSDRAVTQLVDLLEGVDIERIAELLAFDLENALPGSVLLALEAEVEPWTEMHAGGAGDLHGQCVRVALQHVE